VWYVADIDRHITAVNIKTGESNGIGASDPRVSAGKVLLDIPLAEQEENGRDEVGIDVD
jgi:hypothetical protein